MFGVFCGICTRCHSLVRAFEFVGVCAPVSHLTRLVFIARGGGSIVANQPPGRICAAAAAASRFCHISVFSLESLHPRRAPFCTLFLLIHEKFPGMAAQS